MDEIRFGVIGCGHWGPNIVRNLVDLPMAKVVAVSDLREDRLRSMEELYPDIQTTQDYRDFFSMDLDAAVIATPPASHFEIARECLNHDLPVLVEKPMALSTSDAEELNGIARERGLCLMVGHTFEYTPAARVMKELIASGELGDVYFIDATRANLGRVQWDLDVVWDLASHDIAALIYLLGQEPVSVGASGGSYVLQGIHDIAHLNLEFPGGVTAHIRVSWLDPNKVRRITVVGSRKMAVYDDVSPIEKIKIYDRGVDLRSSGEPLKGLELNYRFGDVVIPHIELVEPLRIECEDFVRSVATGTEPQCSGRSGSQVVRVLEAADRSLQNGGDHTPIVPAEQPLHQAVQLQTEPRLVP